MSFIKDLLKWGAVRGSRDPVTGVIDYLTAAGNVIGLPTIGVPQSQPLRVALIGDSITWNAAITAPIDYTGVEKGLYNTALTLTNLTSTFIPVAYADGNCGQDDDVVIAFDGIKYLTVNIASEGVGDPVDITGGGFFRVVSAGGTKGVVVAVNWAGKTGAQSDTITASLGNRVRYLMNSAAWFAPALARNGYRHLNVRNYGITGDTTVNLLSRISQVTAWTPHVALMMIGVNNYTDSTTVADIQGVISALNAVGCFVVISTTMPRGGTSETGSKQLANIVNQIKALAQGSSYRVLVIDGFSMMTSPSSASGDSAVNSAYYRSDLVHPNILGTMQGIAPNLYPILARVIPPLTPCLTSGMDTYDATYNPYGNFLGTKGAFAGIAGTLGTGASGHLGTSWTDVAQGGATTVVYTAPDDGTYARTDGIAGYWQRGVLTNSSGSNGYRVIYATATGVTVGQNIRIHGTIRLSAGTLVNRCEMYAYMACSSNGDANNYATQIGNSGSMVSGTLADTGAMYFSSDVMTVPAEATSVKAYFLIGVATGGGVTFDIQDARIEVIP